MAGEVSPFELDPNKLDGYPSVYNLADIGQMPYTIDSRVRNLVYGSFTNIGNTNILQGKPSFNYDIGSMPYTIYSDCRSIVYGHFTHIGNSQVLGGNPSYNYDIGSIPYTIYDDVRYIVYGSFTPIGNPNILQGKPSYNVEITSTYEIIDDVRYIVYGSFTDIGTTKLDGNPILPNTLDIYANFGAFSYSGLMQVSIPKTTKFIADWSFWDSNLKKAVISEDCIYYEHSFPEDCQVEFYED